MLWAGAGLQVFGGGLQKEFASTTVAGERDYDTSTKVTQNALRHAK